LEVSLIPGRTKEEDQTQPEDESASSVAKEQAGRERQHGQDQPLGNGKGNLRPEADTEQPNERQDEKRHPCPPVDDTVPAVCSARSC